MLRWSETFVVKGLLKQSFADFNVSKCWKYLIGKDPNGDRSLEWSKEDAVLLQTMLRFHQGTPEDVAIEAYELARASSSLLGVC